MITLAKYRNKKLTDFNGRISASDFDNYDIYNIW